MEEKLKDSLKELLLEGLYTDGAHHKQWYLERVLVLIGYDLEEVKKEESQQNKDYDGEEWAWDKGIAP